MSSQPKPHMPEVISEKFAGNQIDSQNLSVASERKPGEIYRIVDQTSSLPRHKIITVFLACAAVDFTAIFDETSLAVALPSIGGSLGAGTQVNWIALAYFITSTSFQLIYGRLSDIWSRKIILLIGLLIFFIGSLGASLSKNVTQLIIFRAFTGIGGGGLGTVAQIIVGDVVSLRERGRWQGILGAVCALANAAGPVIGGRLTSISPENWRWIFRLNLFSTFFTVLMVIFFMPLKKVEGYWKEKLFAIDFFGAALTLIGSSCIMLGLHWGGSDASWISLKIILSITVGGFLFAIFLIWQWKGTRLPLLPPHIFKYRMVNGATLTSFTNGWNYTVQIYYIPTFYQLAYGYSPTRAACLMLPIPLVQTFSSTMSGWIITWRGRYRESIILGYGIWAIGLGLFSTLNKTSSLFQQIFYAVLTGLGAGQTLQPGLIALQAGVERENMAVVTCGRHFIRNLGATFGLAVTGSMINNSLWNTLSSPTLGINLSIQEIRNFIDSPTLIFSLDNTNTLGSTEEVRTIFLSAYFQAFRYVFYVSAALASAAALVAVFLMPQLELGEKGLRQEICGDEERGIVEPKQVPK